MGSEEISSNDRIYEAARSFIDDAFLSHADQEDVDYIVEQVTDGMVMTKPAYIKSSYLLYLKESLVEHQDYGKTLRQNATNLAALKAIDSTLPEDKRIITIQDELTLFRNSLIAVISSKVQSIEVNIAAYGSEKRLDFLRSICSEDFRKLHGLNHITAEIDTQESRPR